MTWFEIKNHSCSSVKLPDAADSELLVLVDDDDGKDVVHRYQVTRAGYNCYASGSETWIYFEANADVLLEPSDIEKWQNAQPRLRIRIRGSKVAPPQVKVGSSFKTTAYDDANDVWLAEFYHFSHDGLAAELNVIEKHGDGLVVSIKGVSEVTGPIRLRAKFENNQNLRWQ